MDILLIILMVSFGMVNIFALHKSAAPRAITGPAPVKELTASAPAHSLSRTWIVSTAEGRVAAGWRWRCSCGVWGLASDATNRFNPTDRTTSYNLGTEKAAISGYKEHARQYNEVNTDYYKTMFEKEQADFAEYRKLCYCKDANDALILWKDK